MIGILLTAAGLLGLLATLGTYAAAVPRGTNGNATIAVGVGIYGGAALAVSGGIWSYRAGDSLWVVLPLATLTLLLAGFLLFLHAQRKPPKDTITVRVGEAFVPFAALKPSGEAFHSDALKGRRFMLKFFRGEWCPFCQAELKAFDAMSEALGAYGVEVLALSKDSPPAALQHQKRDALKLELLCDPDLAVVRAYGVEHHKALQIANGWRFSLFGMALGTRPSFRSMAAPTTLLIDERGIVRWIDQTEDYKVRSSATRVLAAVKDVFGPVRGVVPAAPDFPVQPLVPCEQC